MLELQAPIHVMKILLRHSLGAIGAYLKMPPEEKVRWQERTLSAKLMGSTRASTKERNQIRKILVCVVFSSLVSGHT